jgi:hypothetical protein
MQDIIDDEKLKHDEEKEKEKEKVGGGDGKPKTPKTVKRQHQTKK